MIPDKSDGGRTGKRLYQLLMDCVRSFHVFLAAYVDTHIKHADMPDEYEWVTRHTWQSWRERYKTRQDEFDPAIQRIAEQLNPSPRRTYDLNRKAAKTYRSRQRAHSDDDEEDDDDGVDIEELRAPRRRRNSTDDERPARRRSRRTENEDVPEEPPSPSQNKGKQRARERSVPGFDSEL